jgi:hypothetical protein
MTVNQAWSGIWSDVSVNSAHGLGDRTSFRIAIVSDCVGCDAHLLMSQFNDQFTITTLQSQKHYQLNV